MSNMKYEWFDNFYGEFGDIVDQIERGLTEIGIKKNANNRDSKYNKPTDGLWSECEVCDDRSTAGGTNNNSGKEDKGLTKEDYFRFDLYNIQDELADILLTKHEDYGPSNISDAPGGALNGIRVRMYDKIARLNNLIDNNKEPKHESIRDTLIDIANYATIAIMVIDDKWDK